MKTMIAVAAAALLLGAAGDAQAQGWFWGGTYSMSMPLSNTKDFNSKFSFRGMAIEGRKVMSENATVGLSFGWQVMDDTQEGTVQLENGAITGTFMTYTNAFPLFANAHYYFGQRGGIRPYVGANVGVIPMERRAEVGLFAVSDTKWHLAGAPEAGFVIPLGWYVRGFVNARWHFALKAGSAPSQQYVTFNIGIASN